MVKIYTRTGDGGKTGLPDGQRVWKDSLQIEFFGAMDELNSILGIILDFIKKEKLTLIVKSKIKFILENVQHQLFQLGCQVASPQLPSHKSLSSLSEHEVTQLEKFIDTLEKDLPSLHQFILPRGQITSSLLHFARSVCRRAERQCVSILRKGRMNPIVIRYLNRLSDALFVLARWTQKKMNGKEILWKQSLKRNQPKIFF